MKSWQGDVNRGGGRVCRQRSRGHPAETGRGPRAVCPLAAHGRSYRYCVSGGGGAATVFRSSGRTGLVVSTARGYRGDGHRVGQRLPGAHGNAIHLGATHRGGWRYVYGVRSGRVTFVGVASRGSRQQIVGDIHAEGVS
jgi:hypothetical protein